MQQRFFACLLIFLQAWLLWHLSRQPLLPIIACVLAVVSIPKLLRYSVQRTTYNLMIAGTCCAVLLANIWKPADSIGRWILPAQIAVTIAGCFLFLQVLENFRRRPNDSLPAHYCLLSLVTILFCFCRTYMLDDWPTMFWGAVGMAMLVGLFLQSSRNQAVRGGQNFAADSSSAIALNTASGVRMNQWRRWLLMLFSFAGVTFGTWYFTTVLSKNVEYARFLLFPGSTLAQEQLGSSLRYSDTATLNSISESQLSNPFGEALNVFADFEPGYLRGRCYDTFEKNKWLIANENQSQNRISNLFDNSSDIPEQFRSLDRIRKPPVGIRKEGYGQNVVSVTGDENGPYREIRIENDPLRGMVYFTPLGADYLQVFKTLVVQVDQNEVLRRGADQRHPYYAYLNRNQDPDNGAAEKRKELLTIPDSLSEDSLSIADRIFKNDTTDLQRFQSIESWFTQNYNYSLDGFKFPKGVDRLSHFIVERPDLHCEFFASATTLLLRTQGIPTRYATGYVVSERGEISEDHWVALNRNAHAWTEAYDRDRQTWVIVESTPGIEAVKDPWANVSAEEELAQFQAAIERNDDVRAENNSWAKFYAPIRDFFERAGNVVQIVLSMTLIIMLISFLLIRRYLDYRKGQRGSYDPRFARESTRLRNYEKQLRKLGIERSANETIHQFANRLQDMEPARAEQLPWLSGAVEEFLTYARLRYSVSSAGGSE